MSIEVVTIEGNIGAGKTTNIEFVKQGLIDKGYDVRLMPEPVERWLKFVNKEGDDILKLFYKDKNKYAFTFQMLALLTRFQIFRDTYLSQLGDNLLGKKIIFLTERTIQTDKYVFAKMLHEDGFIDDIQMQIYHSWFDDFVKLFPIRLCIYLKTEPDLSLKRVLKRARKGENLDISYLTRLHEVHNTFIEEHMASHAVPTFTIDNTPELESDEYKRNVDSIVNAIHENMLTSVPNNNILVNKLMLFGEGVVDKTLDTFKSFMNGFDKQLNSISSFSEIEEIDDDKNQVVSVNPRTRF